MPSGCLAIGLPGGPLMAQSPSSRPLSWFFSAAFSLALICGLLEALETLALSTKPGMLGWKTGNSVQVLIAAPVVYAIIYLMAALPFALVSRIWTGKAWDAVMVWVLLALFGYAASTLLRAWFSEFAALMLGLGLASVLTRGYLANREPWGDRLRRWAIPLAIAIPIIAIGGIAIARHREKLAVRALPSAPAGSPNVLLLVMDTQRADHLTSYGYPRPTTPRLARLAAEGASFTWASSPAVTTLPSHSSMMTGRLVQEHGAGSGGRLFLDGRFPTLAEQLRSRGYLTGGFVANTYWTGRHTGLNRGFIHYEDYYSSPMDAFTRTVLGRHLAYDVFPRFGRIDIPGRKRAGAVKEELLHWVDANPGRPFFAFLNYFDVHAPYLPVKEFAGHFSSAGSSRDRPHKIEIGAWNENGSLPDSALLTIWRDRYDESLAYMDHEIGALLDSLEARGLLKNAIVVVTGDHGESFGEHGTVHHGGTLHLEQIHVPLILWAPGRVPAGKTVDRPVDLRAIPATLMEAIGEPKSVFPGSSLLGALRDSAGAVSPAISEGPKVDGNPPTWQTGRGWVKSLIRDQWHLIALESGADELYDMRTDPGELHNLIDAPAMREVRTGLEAEMRKTFDLPAMARRSE